MIDGFFQPLPRVPMPMSYKKPRGGKVKLKINPPVPPRLFVDDSEGEDFPSPTSSTSPPMRPTTSSVSILNSLTFHILTSLLGFQRWRRSKT